MTTYQPTSKFDFVTFQVKTEKRGAGIGPKVACCEGRVEVPFGIEGGKVIPGRAKHFPEEDR